MAVLCALLYLAPLRPALTVRVQITPYEMGSFDPSLSAMANMQFLGTHLVGGAPGNASACVTGFNQASFMIGTVSSLFNVSPLRCPATDRRS